MGDFVYNGEHSITFDPDGLNLNTWKTWHMAPKSRPFVVAPQVKTEYIDVPGADGALDYTEALTGKPRYANRTGQWDFIIDNGYRKWHELYSEILLRLHGKKFDKIILDDDPNYYWEGRLIVTGQFGNKDFSGITISYNLNPYKTPVDKTKVVDWKWNDLFSNYIRYGTFTVNGTKVHVVTNDEGAPTTCNVNSTTRMDVFRAANDQEWYNMIQDGFNKVNHEYETINIGDNEFTLANGKNILVFRGFGIVKVEYAGGSIL